MKKNGLYTQTDIMLLRMMTDELKTNMPHGVGQKTFNKLCRLSAVFTGCKVQDVMTDFNAVTTEDIEATIHFWFDVMVDDMEDGRHLVRESTRA